MNLNQWAIKHGVPFEAVEDLRRMMGTVNTDPIPQVGESEAAVQTRVRLEASKKGGRLWRNNVGAYDERYPPSPGTRWGLANETKQMNKMIKSSDLIGIKPILITAEHVGQVIGQFVAREVKRGGWRYGATEAEQAQLTFLELAFALGADAAFATGEGTL
jgi:hypothetical protein